MDGLIEGRNVHYVTELGVHLLALIVKVLDKESGTVNLTVFNDHAEYYGSALCWAETSVQYSEFASPDTWHWIERA